MEAAVDNQGRILVVDDEPSTLELARDILVPEGHAVVTASSGSEAVDCLRSAPFDLVVTDLVMPGMGGLELLKQVEESWPEVPVIILTGNSDIATAVAAIKDGADNYLTKPFDLDSFRVVVLKALERKALRDENNRLRKAIWARRTCFGGLIGAAPAMQALYAEVEAVAPTNSSVLLLGESGTGKEITAREIHRRSQRRDGPFVAVNCGALPPTLLESELFGHKRGAFTGATTTKVGLFEAASGGTIFLDEIGATTMQTQQALLRVLQEREVRPVGDLLAKPIDVRVIAATNALLDLEMGQGTFRTDLYFRLSAVVLRLPALRERPDDLPLLAESLLAQLSRRHDGKEFTLSKKALERLRQHAWPGNVRELENVLERAAILAPRQVIGPADLALPGAPAEDPMPRVEGDQSLERVSREHILSVLERCGGNKLRAARILRIPRSSLYQRLAKYGVR